MFCIKCSADIGDELGLCLTCQSMRAQEGMEAVNNPVDYEFLNNPYGSFSILSHKSLMLLFYSGGPIIVLIIAFVGRRIVDPSESEFAAFVAAAVYALCLVSLLAWAKMWMELLMHDFLIALSALLLPIRVYLLLYTYPERTWKPFLVHMVAGFLAIIGYYIHSDLSPNSLFFLF